MLTISLLASSVDQFGCIAQNVRLEFLILNFGVFTLQTGVNSTGGTCSFGVV